MQIKKGKKYRIKGQSKYFKEKYGTSNPIILIEDTDYKVFGGSCYFQTGNPACLLFAMRGGFEGLPTLIKDKENYYGKIGSMGELVHKNELEKI